jgi:hypothetical protein
LGAASGQVEFEGLYPLLWFGHEMSLYAGDGALGRFLYATATVTPTQIDNHAPAPQPTISRFLAFCLGIVLQEEVESRGESACTNDRSP